LKRHNLVKTLAISLSILVTTTIINPVKAYANTTEPQIIGSAAITMDIETKEVIYSKNADSQMSPASTTKLMTSLLFAENKNKTDIITYTADAAKVVETSLNNLVDAQPGDKITAEDVMEAVMVYSANDTAYLMAESVAGSVDKFVTMMNEKATALGLKNTVFYNPSGLEIDPLNPTSESINLTTAYDLAIIAIEAYDNEWIRDVMAPSTTPLSVNLGSGTIIVESRNLILGKNGNVGGKTGTEDLAGRCFVGFYERDGRKLVTVVLNSEYGVDGMPVFDDTEKIADFSYSYEKTTYKNSDDEVLTLNLTYKTFGFFGMEKTIEVPVKLVNDVSYYQNTFNDQYSKFTYESQETDAWKLSSNKKITLTYSSELYKEDVPAIVKISSLDLIKSNLASYILALLVIIIVIAIILFMVKVINLRKRRSSRRRRY